MHDTEYRIAGSRRVPWNKGKLIGPRPPLRQKHVWAIRTRLQIEQQVRDLALFNLAIDSKLRGCDVVAIRVDDVASNGHAIERASVRQRKTGLPVRFELTEQTRQAINEYLAAARKKLGDYLFSGRRFGQSMTTRQYARLLSDWLVGVGLDPHVYGTHSLRRTKATLIYRRTGNLRVFSFFLVTQRSRARCDISASISMMLWRYPSRSTSERIGRRAESRLCPSALPCPLFRSRSGYEPTWRQQGTSGVRDPSRAIGSQFWCDAQPTRRCRTFASRFDDAEIAGLVDVFLVARDLGAQRLRQSGAGIDEIDIDAAWPGAGVAVM